MLKSDVYKSSQTEKLGNALIYLCQKKIEAKEPVYKTYLLKLIFIIDEISVRKYGFPVFDLRYDVWKLGPVSSDLYFGLNDNSSFLSKYIEIDKGNATVKPVKTFSDDEFNDLELQLMEEVADRFLYCTSSELVNHTHKKNSPWYNTAVKHGILDALENGEIPATTDIEIDLRECIQDDQRKLSMYNSHKDFIAQIKNLKS